MTRRLLWISSLSALSLISNAVNANDCETKVKRIVVDHLGAEMSKVVPNAAFIDDLRADSLDTVELVMAFEEEFGCEIPDDAAETMLTVGDAIKFFTNNPKCKCK